MTFPVAWGSLPAGSTPGSHVIDQTNWEAVRTSLRTDSANRNGGMFNYASIGNLYVNRIFDVNGGQTIGWVQSFSFVTQAQGVTATQGQFAVSTSGGTVTGGGATTTTFTLAPVPPGVNGTDTSHWIRIENGTGTAEWFLITGGTAVAGASSGTITGICQNSHSGAWRLATATGGFKEAEVDAASGTVLVVPLGQTRVYAGTVITKALSFVAGPSAPGVATVIGVGATSASEVVTGIDGLTVFSVACDYSVKFEGFRIAYDNIQDSGHAMEFDGGAPVTGNNTGSSIVNMQFFNVCDAVYQKSATNMFLTQNTIHFAGTGLTLQDANYPDGGGTCAFFNQINGATTTGVCNTVGTAVTRTSGSNFRPGMVGKSILLGSGRYFVAGFTDASHITLSTSAGSQTGPSWVFGAEAAVKVLSGGGHYVCYNGMHGLGTRKGVSLEAVGSSSQLYIIGNQMDGVSEFGVDLEPSVDYFDVHVVENFISNFTNAAGFIGVFAGQGHLKESHVTLNSIICSIDGQSTWVNTGIQINSGDQITVGGNNIRNAQIGLFMFNQGDLSNIVMRPNQYDNIYGGFGILAQSGVGSGAVSNILYDQPCDMVYSTVTGLLGAADGSTVFCTNAIPFGSGGGSGAMCFRQNGTWTTGVSGKPVWVSATLSGSWATAGSTWYTPAVAIGPDGCLHLSGGFTITSYANGSQVFQLPSSSLYPAKKVNLTVLASDSTSGSFVGLLVIDVTGAATLFSAAGAGHTVSFWMDGLSARLV